MRRKNVEELLRNSNGDYISGEAMSQELGISRAAIWKQIQAMREAGYQIEAAPRKGYRLAAVPDLISSELISGYLGEHPWAGNIHYLDTVGSTNTFLKQMAEEGAPHGTVVIAGEQTQGRGRLGRSFVSPKGCGIYLSALLRPESPPDRLSHVTALAAVAAADAIERVTQVHTEIKWPNDLVAEGKKLVGILTELSVEWETARTQYLVIGIGINANHTMEDFPGELQGTASSLALLSGRRVERGRLAAELIRNLSNVQPEDSVACHLALEKYRKRCLTIGKRIQVLRAGQSRTGFAVDVSSDFGLLVRYDDGSSELVNSGEVSVRGLYGYTE